MDMLSEIFKGAGLRCRVDGAFDFRAPWCVRLGELGRTAPDETRGALPLVEPPEPGRGARSAAQCPPGEFVIVTHGRCWIEGATNVELPTLVRAGDMLILTRAGHPWLGQSFGSTRCRIDRAQPGEDRQPPAPGQTARLIRGRLTFDHPRFANLFSALPPRVHVSAGGERPDAPGGYAARAFISEIEGDAAGRQGVLDQLAHVLLIHAVRACLVEPPRLGDRWLRALVDADVGPALAAIHANPGAPWTVATLAATVSMSRSAFAARFTATVGGPPLQYLTHYRMRRAADLLRSGGAGVKEVAGAVSYDSEAAFGHAFKRYYGVAPGAYRQPARPGSAVVAPPLPRAVEAIPAHGRCRCRQAVAADRLGEFVGDGI